MSLSNLLESAWTAGPMLFRKFITCVVKRAVRLSRLRSRRRSINYVCGPQQFWREDVDSILGMLRNQGVVLPELEAPAWRRGLPRRISQTF